MSISTHKYPRPKWDEVFIADMTFSDFQVLTQTVQEWGFRNQVDGNKDDAFVLLCLLLADSHNFLVFFFFRSNKKKK